jgi:hypothetical protein
MLTSEFKDFGAVFVGEISKEEVEQMPYELKVCWMLQPWGRLFVPRSVDEWAYTVGWCQFNNEGNLNIDELNNIRVLAAEKAREQITFIRENILNPHDNHTMGLHCFHENHISEYNESICKNYKPEEYTMDRFIKNTQSAK